MTVGIRGLLSVEAAAFGLASLIHAGVLLDGHSADAQRAELVIALVLVVGIVMSMVRPERTRAPALAT